MATSPKTSDFGPFTACPPRLLDSLVRTLCAQPHLTAINYRPTIAASLLSCLKNISLNRILARAFKSLELCHETGIAGITTDDDVGVLLILHTMICGAKTHVCSFVSKHTSDINLLLSDIPHDSVHTWLKRITERARSKRRSASRGVE
ncbi:hypothetical protein FDG2_1778 [Candidatus Protofrankia californiensis]|uniref:Uncharacterized protein n=1 Tax=Candidatus Protofrankia californiensis TaxID=1839754 RepID=A0A1C3NW98_9ACTN|nr:hypothetical protein FDG2_1778 [Candidatus Protofrankia californiensis]